MGQKGLNAHLQCVSCLEETQNFSQVWSSTNTRETTSTYTTLIVHFFFLFSGCFDFFIHTDLSDTVRVNLDTLMNTIIADATRKKGKALSSTEISNIETHLGIRSTDVTCYKLGSS